MKLMTSHFRWSGFSYNKSTGGFLYKIPCYALVNPGSPSLVYGFLILWCFLNISGH